MINPEEFIIACKNAVPTCHIVERGNDCSSRVLAFLYNGENPDYMFANLYHPNKGGHALVWYGTCLSQSDRCESIDEVIDSLKKHYGNRSA